MLHCLHAVLCDFAAVLGADHCVLAEDVVKLFSSLGSGRFNAGTLDNVLSMRIVIIRSKKITKMIIVRRRRRQRLS